MPMSWQLGAWVWQGRWRVTAVGRKGQAPKRLQAASDSKLAANCTSDTSEEVVVIAVLLRPEATAAVMRDRLARALARCNFIPTLSSSCDAAMLSSSPLDSALVLAIARKTSCAIGPHPPGSPPPLAQV